MKLIISSLFKLHFLIFSLISFILLMLFSILIQLIIICLNLSLSFHSLFRDLHFFRDIFIFSGSFSLSLIIFSLQNKSLYWLSTSDNNSSSLSFRTLLILVNVFWMSDFNLSLSLFIFSNIFFNSFIELFKLSDKSSNYLILLSNFFFFSSFISSKKQTSQSLCWPFPFHFNLVIHESQHNILWFLQ